MTFVESVKFCLTKGYAKFQGRASRSEYWWFVLFYLCIYLVFLFFEKLFALEFAIILMFIRGLASLVLFLPSLCVSVRRLHDLNLSGWWLCFIYIPLIIIFIMMMMFISYFLMNPYNFVVNSNDIKIIIIALSGLVLGISALVFLVLFMLEGTRGANRFGNDPIEREFLQENTEENLTQENSNHAQNDESKLNS